MGLVTNAAATPASMSPQAIMSKMHLPPHMVKPFQAVIVAGMKVLFSDQTHQMVMKQMSGAGPLSQKLGDGIARLMSMLFQESHRSIPPQLLIPAGMVLLAHAADFMNKSGQPVSAQDFGTATQIMVEELLKAFNVDPSKVMANMPGKAGTQPPAAAAPMAPAAQPGAQ